MKFTLSTNTRVQSGVELGLALQRIGVWLEQKVGDQPAAPREGIAKDAEGTVIGTWRVE